MPRFRSANLSPTPRLCRRAWVAVPSPNPRNRSRSEARSRSRANLGIFLTSTPTPRRRACRRCFCRLSAPNLEGNIKGGERSKALVPEPIVGGHQHGLGSSGGRIDEGIQVPGLHQGDVHRQPEHRFGPLRFQLPRSPVHGTALGNLPGFPKYFPTVANRIGCHFRVAGHHHYTIGQTASADGRADVFQHGPDQLSPLPGREQPGQALLGSLRILDGKKDDRHHGPMTACARATLSARPAMTVLVTLTCIPRPSISFFRALSRVSITN